MSTVRVALPAHLRALTRVEGEVRLSLSGPGTVDELLDALEARHPELRGTIREHRTGERRAFIRYFACGRDLSMEPTDAPLPDAVLEGEEAFKVVGAVAGG